MIKSAELKSALFPQKLKLDSLDSVSTKNNKTQSDNC